MSFVRVHERFRAAKIAYYTWFQHTSLVTKIGLSLAMALVTGVAAQVRVALPFTPVPITAQVFAVLLAGVLLGAYFGGTSMLLYVLLGYAGIPWFTNATTGLPFGPTSGYLVGFIPAAFFIGHMVRYQHLRRSLLLVMLGGIGIIYLFGAINFAFFMKTGFKATLYMAVAPFIPFDIAKALCATLCARILLSPEQPELSNNE